jgi:hypothetical protein
MMKSILKRFAGPVVCASLVGVLAFAGDADATQKPISGAVCGMVVSGSWSQFVPGQYLLTRTQNGGVSNPDTTGPHDITCALPRLSTSNARFFFVDGDNNGGGVTNCTIFSYNFGGGLQSSVNTGPINTAQFDTQVNLPAGNVFDYFTAKCTLSSGGRSILRGITVNE